MKNPSGPWFERLARDGTRAKGPTTVPMRRRWRLSDGALRGKERCVSKIVYVRRCRCACRMARLADHDEHRAPAGRRFVFPRGGWWLVPVTGAVAAAGLWFIVQPAPVVPPLPSAKQVEAPAPEAPPPSARDEAQSPASDAAARQPRRRVLKQERELAAGRVEACCVGPAAPHRHAAVPMSAQSRSASESAARVRMSSPDGLSHRTEDSSRESEVVASLRKCPGASP